VNQLQSQLKSNSKNSSRPPSSEGLNKGNRKKKRKKTGRKQGGQPGHKGQSLEFCDDPHKVNHLLLEQCPECSTSLESEAVLGSVNRQQWEIPPIELYVTEWQAEQKMV